MSDESQLTRPQRRKAQRAAMMAQLFANFVVMAVTGQYMILYANDVVGLSPQQIAIIFSIAPFVSILRLPAIPFIQRYGLINTFRIARLFQAAIVILLILIPSSYINLPLLALLLGVFILFREIGLGTVWGPLMHHISTNEDRGAFFARMRTSFTLVTLMISAMAAFLIGAQMEEYQYKILLVIAILGIGNSYFWTRDIPEPKLAAPGPRNSLSRALKNLWQTCRKSPLFRIPLLTTLIISMAQLPIDLVYFREGLQVPANLLALKIFFTLVRQVLSLIFWGKTSDTLGFRPTLAGLLWLTAAIPLILWIIPVFPAGEATLPEILATYPIGASALLLFGFGTGVLNAGLGIVTTAVMHYHVDSRDNIVTLNMFSLFQLFFQAAMMIAVGTLLQIWVVPLRTLPMPEELFHFDFYKLYRGAFVPLLMVLVIPLVLRLPNLKPWFTVTDFFSIFRHNPIRSLLGNRMLYHEDEQNRLQLARSAGESPNPLNLNLLGELLRDPSYEVKVEAIRGLARSRSPFAEKALLDILGDRQRRGLWESAAWALGELRSSAAVPALIPLLDPSLSSRIRGGAARALGKIGNPQAIGPILESARHEEERLHVIASCAWALLCLQAEERADFAFSSLLRLRDREERYELLSILSRWLHITDKWLLVSEPDSTAAQSLEDYLAGLPDKWQQARTETIEAFRARDYHAINRQLRTRVDSLEEEERDPLLRSLLDVLEAEASDWSPLSVLATAWLLFRG